METNREGVVHLRNKLALCRSCPINSDCEGACQMWKNLSNFSADHLRFAYLNGMGQHGLPSQNSRRNVMFIMNAAKYFNVGSCQVDRTRQTQLRPWHVHKMNLLLVHERSCLRSLFPRSDSVEKQCFPVSRIHWRIAAQKTGHVWLRNNLATRLKNQSEGDPLRAPPPSMRSPQYTRLQNYTAVFDKICWALR